MGPYSYYYILLYSARRQHLQMRFCIPALNSTPCGETNIYGAVSWVQASIVSDRIGGLLRKPLSREADETKNNNKIKLTKIWQDWRGLAISYIPPPLVLKCFLHIFVYMRVISMTHHHGLHSRV